MTPLRAATAAAAAEAAEGAAAASSNGAGSGGGSGGGVAGLPCRSDGVSGRGLDMVAAAAAQVVSRDSEDSGGGGGGGQGDELSPVSVPVATGKAPEAQWNDLHAVRRRVIVQKGGVISDGRMALFCAG